MEYPLSDTDRQKKFLIVDDHEMILEGTVPALQQTYPGAVVLTAQSLQIAKQQLADFMFNLVIVDLSLPAKIGKTATVDVGFKLLDILMNSDIAPNIMVLSTNVKPLIRLKPIINAYEGGFVAMDKSVPIQSMLNAVEIALRGSIYLPPEVRARPEFDPKWQHLLKLKYQEGLSDKAIAKAMNISDRTVRNYWVRIQDALKIYDDADKDLRVQIQMAARKAGFIS